MQPWAPLQMFVEGLLSARSCVDAGHQAHADRFLPVGLMFQTRTQGVIQESGSTWGWACTIP